MMDTHELKYNSVKWRKRLLIATATEGWIRFEWAHSRFGQIIPVNWEASGFDIGYTAMGYSIDDAYNLITKKAIDDNMEWLILIEDDVLMPADCFVKFSQYMQSNTHPVVSGLYYTKSEPAEPLLFRERGVGPYHDWTLGDKVMVNGIPMGCLLIHVDILREMWAICEPYKTCDGQDVHRVFETPRKICADPELGVQRLEGTQDLYFFDRVIEHDIIGKIGKWPELSGAEFPYLCDTNIFCQHIDRATGCRYPAVDPKTMKPAIIKREDSNA